MLRMIRRFSSLPEIGKHRIKDILKLTTGHESVIINGWIKTIRRHKKVTFLEINDGSCVNNLQVVLEMPNFSAENFYYGSAVEIEGELVSRPQNKPSIELLAKKVLRNNECDPDEYPIATNREHLDSYIRQFPHLRPRQRQTAAVFRIRNQVEMLIHEFFQSRDFVHIHTPTITSSDCEGAGELFSVTSSKADKNELFFLTPSYLTVSGQLHLEACAMGLGNVYTLSPAFRAEQSRPKTHLSEFHMLEVEVTHTNSLDNVMSLLEDSLKSIISSLFKKCDEDLGFLYDKNAPHRDIVEKSIEEPFLRIDYEDIIKLLIKNSALLKTGDVKWGDDLNIEHENFITSFHGDRPVFVTNFPSNIKPFYALRNTNLDTCASFDLLFPTCGEMAGGTIREDNYDILIKNLTSLGLQDEYRWYADLRRHGGVPHGGYGLGFDRLVKFISGFNNIKDVVPFPRASRLCPM